MKRDDATAKWDPAARLTDPIPTEPIPSTFDDVLNMASWLSLGGWALKALDKVDGDFDFQAKVEEWLVGDWEGVATAAAAMRNLEDYCLVLADGVDFHAQQIDTVWDGTAAQEAHSTLAGQTLAIREAATTLRIAAKGYDDVAQGIYGSAKNVGGLLQSLVDLLIATGISLAAAAAGSWTLIAGAVGAAAATYNISQIASTIGKIIAAIEGAMTFVDTFADGVKGSLGSAGDWHPVDIPDPWKNNLLATS